MNERLRDLADPLADEGAGRHGGRFNASLAAGLLWVVAVVPAFFLSFFWLPFAGVILLAALVLAIVALTQGRVLGGVSNLVCGLLGAPVGIFIGAWAVPLYLAKVGAGWMGAIYNLMIQWVYTGEPTSERILETLVPLLLRSVGYHE